MENREKSIGYQITLEDTLSRNLEDLPGEEWKEIKGYEDRYFISNYSRVKSFVYSKPMIIKKTISNGRYKVVLFDKRSRTKEYLTGRLTAIYFIREPKINEVLKYKDKNVLFDVFFNTEWIAKKDSSKAAFSSGNYPKDHGRGLKNGMSKLKPEDIEAIKKKKSEGYRSSQLAREYNVHSCYINRIVNGKCRNSF